MAKFCICTIILTMFAGEFAVTQATQHSPVLELSLDDVHQVGDTAILDLGTLGQASKETPTAASVTWPEPAKSKCEGSAQLVEAAAARTYHIGVRNLGKRAERVLIVPTGSRLSVGWHDRRSRFIDLKASEQHTLDLVFDLNRDKSQDFNAVSLIVRGVAATTLIIDYVALDDLLARRVASGSLSSGPSDNYNDWYYISVGSTPKGYALRRVCGWLTGDRYCEAWSHCKLETHGTERRFGFQMQGHSENNSARDSEGQMVALYQLEETPPQLKPGATSTAPETQASPPMPAP